MILNRIAAGNKTLQELPSQPGGSRAYEQSQPDIIQPQNSEDFTKTDADEQQNTTTAGAGPLAAVEKSLLRR